MRNAFTFLIHLLLLCFQMIIIKERDYFVIVMAIVIIDKLTRDELYVTIFLR